MYTELDKYIAEARKNGHKSVLKVLQLIKAEFQKFLTSSKDAKLDEVQEAKILLKMKDQWLDELQMREKAGRDVTELRSEVELLTGYIPELPTSEDIESYTREVITAYKAGALSMRDMKPIMNIVKEKYPLADGKIISQVVRSILQ